MVSAMINIMAAWFDCHKHQSCRQLLQNITVPCLPVLKGVGLVIPHCAVTDLYTHTEITDCPPLAVIALCML